MNLESASSRADQIARQYLAFGAVPEMSTLVERISAVTPDDVKTLAQNIFSGKPRRSAPWASFHPSKIIPPSPPAS